MGGINCGGSNNKHTHVYGYMKEYAILIKSIFNFKLKFDEGNSYIEQLVLEEQNDSNKSMKLLKYAIKSFKDSLSYSYEATNNVKKSIIVLQPFYRQKDLIKDLKKHINKTSLNRNYTLTSMNYTLNDLTRLTHSYFTIINNKKSYTVKAFSTLLQPETLSDTTPFVNRLLLRTNNPLRKGSIPFW